ncbi:oxygenase MpaB family protein, partial [Thiolapillus sp.]|uniref:oxygenase MpaB family protein n=1 Tax=Thiolapillus sp. TaxID=2017437 RepID=UPI003AF73F91
MLSETMDKDGIKIIPDADISDNALYLQALQNLDADGQWQCQEQCLCRTAKTPPPDIDVRRIEQEIQRLRGKTRCYIWGKGYLAAKKVRFLHASMRFMLTNPASCPPCGNKQNPQSLFEVMSHRDNPWDYQRHGAPISQEQQQAFLHLWRLIGHIMGVHEDLLTDDWQEAEALFATIQQRQAGQSEEGMILTDALMDFLADYLPDAPGVAHRLSAALIISQLGPKHAAFLLDDDLLRETTSFWRRPIYALGGALLKSYLFLREKTIRRFRHLGRITMQRLHEADDCQDSCPIFYATFSLTSCSSVSDFSGFNQTSLTGSQFR